MDAEYTDDAREIQYLEARIKNDYEAMCTYPSWRSDGKISARDFLHASSCVIFDCWCPVGLLRRIMADQYRVASLMGWIYDVVEEPSYKV